MVDALRPALVAVAEAVSLVDMAWGTALTATAPTGGYFVTRWPPPWRCSGWFCPGPI